MWTVYLPVQMLLVPMYCRHAQIWGIKVPEQLKIVGFDDVNIAQFTSPGLTTIHQPVEQMAELAVAAIAQIDEGKLYLLRQYFRLHWLSEGRLERG